jgi:hypothetical protein
MQAIETIPESPFDVGLASSSEQFPTQYQEKTLPGAMR